jgi:hypothetical protein
MTPPVPVLTLNSGVQMPAIGLSVFQTPPEETTAAVEAAGARGGPEPASITLENSGRPIPEA